MEDNDFRNVITRALWQTNPSLRVWFDYDFDLFKFFIDNKKRIKRLMHE